MAFHMAPLAGVMVESSGSRSAARPFGDHLGKESAVRGLQDMVPIGVGPEFVQESVQATSDPYVGVPGSGLGAMAARGHAGGEGPLARGAIPRSPRGARSSPGNSAASKVWPTLSRRKFPLASVTVSRATWQVAQSRGLFSGPWLFLVSLSGKEKPGGTVSNVLPEQEKALGCVRPMGGPGSSAARVTPHAKVVFGGDVHRRAELGLIGRAVRIVTDHTGDGPKLPVALLQVVCGFTENHFQGPLSFVAGHAGFGNAAGVFRVGAGGVGRLGPLLHEGVMGSLMALSASVCGVDACLKGRPGLVAAGLATC